MGAPARSRNPSVFVVVLNWNGLADTLECLESVSRLRYPDVSVVVVDNGSAGSEADRIQAAFPNALLLRNSENTGFARGSNLGIKHALSRGAEYVWLLNNDTVVDPDAMTELVAIGEACPRIGLLSPVVYDYPFGGAVQFCGGMLDRAEATYGLFRSLDSARAAPDPGTVVLWGTALLLKREVIGKVGMLDERYFAYHEDVDYCVRAIEAGFETRIVFGAAVAHRGGRSMGDKAPVREYLMVRNWYLLWRTHLGGWPRRTYPPRYMAWVLEEALAAENDDPAVREYILDGAWDALRGHYGSWHAKGTMPGPLRALLRGMVRWHPFLWIWLLSGRFSRLGRESLGRLGRLLGRR